MMYENGILDCIGDTPVVALKDLLPKTAADLYIKMEGFNPCGSVKDRPALNMVLEAEQKGLLHPGGTIVESTSGNLGTALAMVSAARGYRCIIVVDPRASKQNIAMIRALGAEIDMVTTMNLEDGTYQEARIDRARHLAANIAGAFMPWQYGNPDNPAAHMKTTAEEILEDFPNGPDVMVASVSTGGQISRIGKGLKSGGARTKTVAVDVYGSVVFGGPKTPTAVTGMGLGWVPNNLDESVIDTVYLVETRQCFSTVRLIAKKTGILLGGSSGASLTIAMREALCAGPGKSVLAICPDRGEKYLDELYNDDWMRERKLPIDEDLTVILDDVRRLQPFRHPAAERNAA